MRAGDMAQLSEREDVGFVGILVSGRERYIARAIWDRLQGPKPPADFICNGCTLSPDYIRGYPTWPACVMHDWHYSAENGWTIDRKEADKFFRLNLEFCLKAHGMFGLLAKAVAFFYWRAVRRAGRSSYSGKGDPT